MNGRTIIRQPGRPDISLVSGTMIEFPREPFEMEIIESFAKISFLYNANGLKVQAELW